MKTIGQRLNEPDGLAVRLRTLRLQAGLSGKQFAAELGWQASKISRIEHGQQVPTVADLTAWARLCSADARLGSELVESLRALTAEHADWKRRMRNGQAVVQSAYSRMAAEAHTICYFETAYIPGLLQTPAYAHRVLGEMVDLHGLSVEDIDDAVAARMQRQQVLYDTTKDFEFLIAEPVLWWRILAPDAMRHQLDRLQTVIGLPNVRFGILPFGRRLATVPQNAFQLLDDTALVETFIGETTYRGADAGSYRDALTRLWTNAVECDDARRLIITAAHGRDLAQGR
jgi:transcriptional regulator with XRE-family HTH domain